MRAIFFCNEMLGLGHLRLTVTVAAELVRRERRATALIVTGSPASSGLPLPPRVDTLKLPAAPVTTESSWSSTELRPSAELAIDPGDVAALRSELSLAAVRAFAPELVVVDHLPLGQLGELRAALEYSRRGGGAKVALGLRDYDDATEGRRWTQARVDDVCALFDTVLVYGLRSGPDVRVDRLVAAGVPVCHTGLVAPPPAPAGPADLDPGYLLATAGGGIDGFELLEAVLNGIRACPPGVPAVLVTGPMMAAEQIAMLRAQANGLDVRVERFRRDMDALLAGARAVIAMAGYSTVAEIMSSGKPALLAPRAVPRQEQLGRAQRLTATGRVEMIVPPLPDAARLGELIGRLLDRLPIPPVTLPGAEAAVDILLQATTARSALGS